MTAYECIAKTTLLGMLSLPASAQSIHGTLTDAASGHPVAYAAVGLKNHSVATVSNEYGAFELLKPEGTDGDSLVISAFGYRRCALAMKGFKDGAVIRVIPAAVMLDEVVVRPQSPEYYIREAMRRVKLNYASTPFGAVAYYREKVKENGELVKYDEGVFRSYCPAYLDTVRNHDQLMLYRKADDLHELKFMARENDKKNKGDTSSWSTSISGSFGGPEAVLKSSRVAGKSEWNFLDTTHLHKYHYAFAHESSVNGRPLMVIEFTSRGKADHLREEGRVYLDASTFAVVKIENSGDLIIPVLVRPLLFALGFGVTDPVYRRHVEFSFRDGKWYPQQIRYGIDVRLTKRYWFAPNDRSNLEIDQLYVVNELQTSDVAKVDAAKRFDPKKPMDKQVYNDAGLAWKDVNVVR